MYHLPRKLKNYTYRTMAPYPANYHVLNYSSVWPVGANETMAQSKRLPTTTQAAMYANKRIPPTQMFAIARLKDREESFAR